MDKKLLEQRARAFDYLFDAVVVTDMQGIIIDWNSGAEKLYGWAREDVLGKPVRILHASVDADRIISGIFEAIEHDGHWAGEIKKQHKDGSVGWIESLVIPIFDDDETSIGALSINRDITERIRTEERLHHLAYYDQLTGIPNRTILFDRLDQMLAQSRRYHLQFGLLFIDIDDFKIINDTAGHAVGDEALRIAAQRMRSAIRDTDTVARVGGDEFVVLASDLKKLKDIEIVVKKLDATLSEPCEIEGQVFNIVSSIGIAIFPRDGDTRDTLLTFADHAMYQAKAKKKTSRGR